MLSIKLTHIFPFSITYRKLINDDVIDPIFYENLHDKVLTKILKNSQSKQQLRFDFSSRVQI